MKNTKRSPWAWIPSLYLAEGLPYVAVMTISVILYKRLGVSNADIALYTSWLYLPWVIKPFWSPFVDLLKTKRWWITTMQALLAVGFAGVAFTIPASFFFQATLAFFWLMAFSSATHDIAADGFYMLALDTNQQALYVGIRSTFYRIATIMGQGVLVILAGLVEITTGLEPVRITVNSTYEQQICTTQLPVVSAITASQSGELHFIASSTSLRVNMDGMIKDSLDKVLAAADSSNRAAGFITSENHQVVQTVEPGWWTRAVSRPLGQWIATNFGEQRETAVATGDRTGAVTVAAVCLSQRPEHEIVLNTELSGGDKSITMLKGNRLVFNDSNWDKPAYMVFQADPKLRSATHAEFRGLSGNIPRAWSVTFFVLGALFLAFSLYHHFLLPRPEADHGATGHQTAGAIMREFSSTFVSFFRKPQVAAAIFFMLTFRFSEAQLLKLISPFLLDSRSVGGLGLTTGEVGLVYGTVGIIGLTIGGIIGGVAASRGGLKRWLWPMSLSMLLTAATFLLLGYTQTESLLLINSCVFVEQFGYGFGFTAYMLYLMYYADGPQKTAHYAMCTGLMALGMMLPGMFAGWLQEMLGYNHFFVWVMLCSIVPIIAISLLKIDPNYGKKQKQE